MVRLILLPNGTVAHAEIAHRTLKQAQGYIPEEGLERGNCCPRSRGPAVYEKFAI